MKKPRKRIERNHVLRLELIEKGHIIPPHLIPEWLRNKGFEAAAQAAWERRRGARR